MTALISVARFIQPRDEPELISPPAWTRQAACAKLDVATIDKWFFPGVGGHLDIAAARAVCARCPVRAPCLEHALAEPDLRGVWGGSTERERRRWRRDRRVACGLVAIASDGPLPPAF